MSAPLTTAQRARKVERQRLRRSRESLEQRRARYRKEYQAYKPKALARSSAWRKRNRAVMREHKRLYAKRHPEKIHRRSQEVQLKKYGMTQADYDRIFLEQGGVCRLCGSPPQPAKPRHAARLSVDHCHETGRVRGLLCQLCNLGVFHLERFGASGLEAALEYLKPPIKIVREA